MTLTGGAGPLTSEEQSVLASLLKRQFDAAQGPIAAVPTPNAKEMVVAHLPKAEVGSADAASSTVRARSALTEKVMNVISVPMTDGSASAASSASDTDSKRHLQAQRESLVKRAKPEFIDAVETATGVKVGRPFTAEEVAELKKHLGYVFGAVCPLRRATACSWCGGSMTWLDLRQMKTFFAEKGSKLMSVGEHKIRSIVEVGSEYYKGGTTTFNGEPVEFVRCVNVQAQVVSVLNDRAKAGHLKQCSGTALRATVLGDKGGDFTKLVLVVWDVDECQSPNNSIVLGMYRYGEEYELMKEVFGPVLQQLAAVRVTDISPSPIPPSIKQSTDAKCKPDAEAVPGRRDRRMSTTSGRPLTSVRSIRPVLSLQH